MNSTERGSLFSAEYWLGGGGVTFLRRKWPWGQYSTGVTSLRYTGVITERAVSAGPYTVDSRTYTYVHKWKRSFFAESIYIAGQTVTDRVLSWINPCTIHIHPCWSIENIRTRMVPVFTRSLRWLHGTSRFIHGTNTVDFRPRQSGRKIV
jgi:hypothetical protein